MALLSGLRGLAQSMTGFAPEKDGVRRAVGPGGSQWDPDAQLWFNPGQDPNVSAGMNRGVPGGTPAAPPNRGTLGEWMRKQLPAMPTFSKPSPNPAANPALAAPPPPPPPPGVGWSDYSPSLLDIDQLRSQFVANPAVMQGFSDRLGAVDSQLRQGGEEIGRQRQFGETQVGTLPAEYARIFGGLSGMAQGAAGSSDAAMAAAGLTGGGQQALAPTQAAAQLVQGGFDATVPLLKAGFGEQAAQQQGWLTQLGSEMRGMVDAEQAQYLQGLSDAERSAVADALARNTQMTNEAGQYNASGRQRAAEQNAAAQADWQAQQAQQAADWQAQQLEMATQGYEPGLSLPQIAQQSNQASGKVTKSLQDYAKAYTPGKNEMSTEHGAKLFFSGYDRSKLHPNAQKTYDKLVKALAADPSQTSWPQLLADKNLTKHPRAVSLAMFNAGGDRSIDRLAGFA